MVNRCRHDTCSGRLTDDPDMERLDDSTSVCDNDSALLIESIDQISAEHCEDIEGVFDELQTARKYPRGRWSDAVPFWGLLRPPIEITGINCDWLSESGRRRILIQRRGCLGRRQCNTPFGALSDVPSPKAQEQIRIHSIFVRFGRMATCVSTKTTATVRSCDPASPNNGELLTDAEWSSAQRPCLDSVWKLTPNQTVSSCADPTTIVGVA